MTNEKGRREMVEERWEKEKKKKKKKKRLPAWNDHSGKSLSYCCLKYFDQ